MHPQSPVDSSVELGEIRKYTQAKLPDSQKPRATTEVGDTRQTYIQNMNKTNGPNQKQMKQFHLRCKSLTKL